ncbi:hypothetical protein MC7420_5748 [Coleofasciculus chthonoplastes PCC 7420]|uniref:Uncharacterized protein n=1 Tax=Coleofasciculus chthonoplastes PCC 7420 TaxID=118168 RepID=B4VVN5_9CYAN|nr:hypothetical protein MC7420_5748 [Coleofasciculus chthonoplastes PCC 7420]
MGIHQCIFDNALLVSFSQMNRFAIAFRESIAEYILSMFLL